MRPEDFELVVIDDNSTEDITKVLKPYIGRFNIRYIKADTSKHPFYSGYHTQAVTANIGIKKSQGEICCISQPEMIHGPHNLLKGYEQSKINTKQIFAELILANDRFNQWLDENDFLEQSFDNLVDLATRFGREYEFANLPEQDFFEMYWYICFFPKNSAIGIGGVDEEYLRGVYAEDDNFKSRLRMAGVGELYYGRRQPNALTDNFVVGIHQSHKFEEDLYPKQERDSNFWNNGAEINRQRWRNWCMEPKMMANEGMDWGSESYIIKEQYYGI